MEGFRSTKACLADKFDLILLQKDDSREKIVKAIVDLANQEGLDRAIHVVDLGDIVNKCKEWTRLLPDVKPFYAVKANSDKVILTVLANLGVNFDCASQGEMESVLSLGVSPDRIVYSNTCKHHTMLKYAAENDVYLTIFDNEEELLKIKKIHPNARCLIRIQPSQKFKAVCKLGTKFGCQHDEVIPLLKLAKSIDLNVVGVHFHVGHLCQDAAAYFDAICRSKEVFEEGKRLEFDMKVLNIGGGFPGKRRDGFKDLFAEFCRSINDALNQFFPNKDIAVIAEPGEYVVASAAIVCTKIIARRVERLERVINRPNGEKADVKASNQNKRFVYYLNDGVHGSFRKHIFIPDKIFPHEFGNEMGEKGKENEEVFESKLFGPSCNSLDILPDPPPLREHQIGEWFYFPNMGAYSTSLRSTFNGMPMPSIKYICLAETWYEVFPNEKEKERLVKS